MSQTDSIRITNSSITIELPEISSIGNVELQFDSIFQKDADNEKLQTLIISLANVKWLDISSLTFLISITHNRNRNGKVTKYILPSEDNDKKNEILIYLHTWRFFFILKEITDKQIKDYLLNPQSFESIINFSIKNKNGLIEEIIEETPLCINLVKDYFRKFYDGDEGLKTLHFDKKFFPLISKPFKTLSEKSRTLNDTLSDWKEGSLIVSVLEQHINNRKNPNGNSEKEELDKNINNKRTVNRSYENVINMNDITIQNKLANDVIKESITNSIRHPKADILITGSYFDKKGKYFTIVIWDNGQSIIESLINGLKKYKTITNSANKNLGDVLNPSYFLTDGSEDRQNYDEINIEKKLFFSNDLPTLNDPEWKFLLASFYPAVTSKPVLHKQEKKDLGQEELDFGDRTGMGLTVLLDSIVKVFDGTVTARIDNYMITIKRINTQFQNTIYRKKHNEIFIQPLTKRYIKDKIDFSNLKKTNFIYQVKIVNKKKNSLFCGNMLTIKIPLS